MNSNNHNIPTIKRYFNCEKCNNLFEQKLPINKKGIKCDKCDKCGYEYLAEAEPQWDENYCFTYWESNCPKCNNLNEINDCYWR